MDVLAYIELGLITIGAATVLFRAIAPITEAKWDNKVLKVLEKVLETVALNKDRSKLEVKLR